MHPDHEKIPLDDTAQWRREERRELWGRLVRWGLGIPLILFSYPRLGWFGPFFIVLGCILIAPDLAGYCSQFFGGILWSHRKGQIKPLYSIAESLVARGKYEEAEKEYETIIQQFPNEVKPHADMISIAIVQLKNAELADLLYQRGMTLLRDPAARKTLTQMHAGIRTRLQSRDIEHRPIIAAAKLDEIRARLKRDRAKMWR